MRLCAADSDVALSDGSKLSVEIEIDGGFHGDDFWRGAAFRREPQLLAGEQACRSGVAAIGVQSAVEVCHPCDAAGWVNESQGADVHVLDLDGCIQRGAGSVGGIDGAGLSRDVHISSAGKLSAQFEGELRGRREVCNSGVYIIVDC